MNNWLIYMHTISASEDLDSWKALNRMHKNLISSKKGQNISIYVLKFESRKTQDVHFIKYTSDNKWEHETPIMKYIDNEQESNIREILKYQIDYLLERSIDIHALTLYSHSCGYGLGSWKNMKRPFIAFSDFVYIVVNPFPMMKLICFDSCESGMSCLYELPSNIVTVISSPGLHPHCSVIWTTCFTNLSTFTTNEEWISFAHCINHEWNTYCKSVKWKCLYTFDMKYVPLLAKEVQSNIDKLVLDKKSQIHKKDANLHDLYEAAVYVPQIQKLIKMMLYKCPDCFSNCNVRIKGPSIEARLPRKWLYAFTSSKWYKDIVRNQKGYEDTRLQNIIDMKLKKKLIPY